MPISMVVVTDRILMRWSSGCSDDRKRSWNQRSMFLACRRPVSAVWAAELTGYGSAYPDPGLANSVDRRK